MVLNNESHQMVPNRSAGGPSFMSPIRNPIPSQPFTKWWQNSKYTSYTKHKNIRHKVILAVVIRKILQMHFAQKKSLKINLKFYFGTLLLAWTIWEPARQTFSVEFASRRLRGSQPMLLAKSFLHCRKRKFARYIFKNKQTELKQNRTINSDSNHELGWTYVLIMRCIPKSIICNFLKFNP